MLDSGVLKLGLFQDIQCLKNVQSEVFSTTLVRVRIKHLLDTRQKKAPSVFAKCLIYSQILVGDASFELATPAV